MALPRPIILDHFQAWVRTAPAGGRADGVRVLARAILDTDLGESRRDAVAVLTTFLDDPSPLVRMALAEAVASHPRAPHHLLLALADDQPGIAALVLARSPILGDAALVDCAATAHPSVQAALAGRRDLSVGVGAALAEVAAPQALAALAANREAVLTATTIRRMVERGGDDAALREALLKRSDLPPDVRIALVAAASRTLASLVAERGWLGGERMQRVSVEARDRATVAIGNDIPAPARLALAAHLRATGQLTVGLAFRAILSGGADLFRAVLCELTGAPDARVEAALRTCGSAAFASLYRDAGLPSELLPAFRAAVRAAADVPAREGRALSLAAVERVIAACESLQPGDDGEVATLVVMLRRFEAEAARDEARARERASREVPTGEPLILSETGGSAGRGTAARRPRYTIDLAAIEAQLCAA